MDKYINLYKKELSKNIINQNRNLIYNRVNKISNLKYLIKKIFIMLNKLYIGRDEKKIIFNTSNRMTKTAGSLKVYVDNKNNYFYELVVSENIYNNLFSNNEKWLEINGIKCTNKILCIINLIEHEFIHYLIAKYDRQDWKYGMHSDKFKVLMHNMFRHTKWKHNLLDGQMDKQTINKLNELNKKKLTVNKLYKLKINNKIVKVKILKLGYSRAIVLYNKCIYSVPFYKFLL
jgi:hypothetical protein